MPTALSPRVRCPTDVMETHNALTYLKTTMVSNERRIKRCDTVTVPKAETVREVRNVAHYLLCKVNITFFL